MGVLGQGSSSLCPVRPHARVVEGARFSGGGGVEVGRALYSLMGLGGQNTSQLVEEVGWARFPIHQYGGANPN